MVMVVFTKEVVASTGRPLSRSELLEGIQNWRKILKNIPGNDAHENDLQQEFLFRLQFLCERRYEGNDASLIRIIDFMKELESHPSNISSSALTPFLEILVKSIKEIREAQEPLWPFVQQFMVNNSLKNPVSFEETVKQRDYLNQFETVSAARLTHEDINQYFISLEVPIPGKEPQPAALTPAQIQAPAPTPPLESQATPIQLPSTKVERPENLTDQPLNPGDGAQIGELKKGPGAKLSTEAGALDSAKGQTDVGPIKVIESEQPTSQP